MRALSAAELLAVWDRGLVQPLGQRALLLLTAAYPEVRPETLARLSIGQRNACLLTLREWTFGRQLESLTNCPVCHERLELNFAVADVRVAEAPPTVALALPAAGEQGQGEEYILEHSGYRVRFRLPDTLDLTSVLESGQRFEDIPQARTALLARCLLAVERNGEVLASIVLDELPPELITAMLDRMAQVDPQADITLALNCPACRHQWPAMFDILSFFWQEIDAWAQRLLDDVHTLASAYGWPEADILGLSPHRRQFYLERIRG
jgi:hypothetical protein